MRIPLAFALFAICGLVGCSSASPDPALMAAELPPQRELSPQQVECVRIAEAEAVALLDIGDHLAARAAAERALQIDPRAAKALAVFASARLRVAQREHPPVLAESRRAEGEMRRASAVAPTDPVVAVLHARFLESLGHLSAAVDRAEASLNRTASGVSADPDLLRCAGGLRYELGDERLAVAHFERLIAQPDALDEAGRADVLYRLAQCRMGVAASTPVEQDRIAELTAAAARFSEYRALRSDDVEAYLGEAHAMLQRLSIEGADGGGELRAMRVDPARILTLLERAATLAPVSPRPDFDRAVVLETLGRDAEARNAYAAALARDAAHLPSLMNLGASQAREGMVTEAVLTCRRALARSGLSDGERSGLQRYVEENAPAAAK